METVPTIVKEKSQSNNQPRVQYFPPEEILPNPYQPRTARNPEKFQELVESIREHNLIETPRGRINRVGKPEQQTGHQRKDAWIIAKPGVPFPLIIEDISDEEMSARAIVENHQRDALSPIEKAKALRRHIKEFGTTQLEAGELVGITTQGGVSNLLRLLDLPTRVQEAIEKEGLPERYARELIPIARIDPKYAEQLALEVMKKDELNRSEFLDESIGEFLRKKARALEDDLWPLTWPEEPIPTPNHKSIPQIGACKGCPYLTSWKQRWGNPQKYCTRPDCFDLKREIKQASRMEAASKKLGIPLPGKDEKVTVWFDGDDYSKREAAKKALQAKHPDLRLLPVGQNGHHSYLDMVTGNDKVMLGTVNAAAVNRFVEGKKSGTNLKPTEAKKQKQIADKLADERRKERSVLLREKMESLWMVRQASTILGDQLKLSGGALIFLADHIEKTVHWVASNRTPRSPASSTRKWKKRSARRRPLRRKKCSGGQIALRFILGEVFAQYGGNDRADLFRSKRVREEIIDLAEEMQAQLPPGWDKVPVLHTSSNCWHCGRFGSQEKGSPNASWPRDGWWSRKRSARTFNVPPAPKAMSMEMQYPPTPRNRNGIFRPGRRELESRPEMFSAEETGRLPHEKKEGRTGSSARPIHGNQYRSV